MKVIYFLVLLSCLLVISVSSITIIFAYRDYKNTNQVVTDTISKIHILAQDRSVKLHKEPFKHHINKKGDYLDKESPDVAKKQLLSLERLTDKVESIKKTAFDNNTLTFLFTVFSLVFVSFGIYLLGEIQQNLSSIKEKLKIDRWVSTSASFLQQLVSFESAVSYGEISLAAMPNIRDLSKWCLESLEEMARKEIGMPEEQIERCKETITRIDSSIEEMILKYKDKANTVKELERIKSRIVDMNRELDQGNFLDNWKKAFESEIFSGILRVFWKAK